MKKMRMFLSILLCFTLLAGIFCPAALPAAAAGETRLYNVYGDHMLFQQKAEAVFAGVSAPGTALTVTLSDAAGAVVRSARGTAGADGTFRLSFTAPAGGYAAYTVVLTANGVPVSAFSDVVFGELWLSFGQSNMEYTLNITPEGKAMQAAGQTGSRNIRVLHVPHPVKDGAICADKLPQTDAQNCFWFTADQSAVYGISAVAYFFAEELLSTLDMPVGILNTAVGGSGIGAWIPRDTIESDASLKQAVVDRGAYIALSDWDAGERQYHIDMTGLYNSKIAPLVHFRPAGAIWYQGETDLMLYNDVDYYCRLFTALQNSYTELFAYENGCLPLIFTQIAAYNYGRGPYAVTKFNEAFTRFAAEDPESRCEVTITDLPLDYYEDCGAIHPMTKLPIGQRMAACAEALCYDGEGPSSAPVATSVRADGNGLLVTFNHVGDGLVCAGDTLRGFAVYGADGVCLPAEAEIVSKDTVRLESAAVPAPVGATYAANSMSPRANLYSGRAGKPFMPAAAFGASDEKIVKLSDNAAWLACDTLSAWQNAAHDPGLRDVWTAENAQISLAADVSDGTGVICVAGEKRSFSVSASFADTRNGKQEIFDSVDADFTAYGTLTLRLKNAGSADVTLSALRLYKNAALYYCPLCTESGKNAVILPADGQWHAYTFDLNALGLAGSAVDRWSNDALDGVTELRLCFTGSGAALRLGGCAFGPETEQKTGGVLQRVITRLLAFFQKIKDFFTNIFGG